MIETMIKQSPEHSPQDVCSGQDISSGKTQVTNSWEDKILEQLHNSCWISHEKKVLPQMMCRELNAVILLFVAFVGERTNYSTPVKNQPIRVNLFNA